MTRMEKYAQKRRVIEIENMIFFIEHPYKWSKLKRKAAKKWKQ